MLGAEIDLRDALDGIDAMRAKGMDLRPVWRAMRPLIKQDLLSHFAAAEGPGGMWPQLAPSTVARRLAGKGMTYKRGRRSGQATKRAQKKLSLDRLLGRLKTAWRFESTPGQLVVRSMASWADVHQMSGHGNHGAQIPMRQFAWASDRVFGAITDTVQAFVRSAW